MSSQESPVVAFQAYGASHLAMLAVFVTAAVVLTGLSRSGWRHAMRKFEVTLALVLLMQWPADLWISWQAETLDWGNALPLHLCGVSAFLGALALLTQKSELCELLYFWGLAGTLQGLLTPALMVDWPHPRFVHFFVLHESIVLAAYHLVFNRGHAPRPGAVPRAMAWLSVYIIIVGTVNAVIQKLGGAANYGFLCAKPPTASLFDVLGPWPWYVGTGMFMAWIIFSILDLPFALKRRRRG